MACEWSLGQGQGLFSLVAYQGGASVVSVDVNSASVRATNSLRDKIHTNWEVLEGSILDDEFIAELGTFDVVVSWGVCTTPGDVFHAIDNAASLVRPGLGFG